MSSPAQHSAAFAEFVNSQREVVELLRAAPTYAEQLHSRGKSQRANALYRGAVVLLSSHLERYVESLVVEAIDAMNAVSPHVSTIPDELRLVQIEHPLRRIYEMKDLEKKVNALQTFVGDMAWFWDDNQACNQLKSDSLIQSFDNPLPARINRLFEYFGITGVVDRAVDLDHSIYRLSIQAKVKELVTKRNAIAHTGMTTDVTREDVVVYWHCSRRLVRGIDVVIGRQVQGITTGWPWEAVNRSVS